MGRAPSGGAVAGVLHVERRRRHRFGGGRGHPRLGEPSDMGPGRSHGLHVPRRRRHGHRGPLSSVQTIRADGGDVTLGQGVPHRRVTRRHRRNTAHRGSSGRRISQRGSSVWPSSWWSCTEASGPVAALVSSECHPHRQTLDAVCDQSRRNDPGEQGGYGGGRRLYETMTPAYFALGDRSMLLFVVICNRGQHHPVSVHPAVGRVADLTRQMVLAMGLAGLIMAAIAISLAPVLVPAAFGEAYRDATLTLQIMFVSVPLIFATNALMVSLYSGGRERSVAKYTVIVSVAGTASVIAESSCGVPRARPPATSCGRRRSLVRWWC